MMSRLESVLKKDSEMKKLLDEATALPTLEKVEDLTRMMESMRSNVE